MAGKLVEHYNAHVPFVVGTVALVAAAVVLSTVQGAWNDADSEDPEKVCHRSGDVLASTVTLTGAAVVTMLHAATTPRAGRGSRAPE